MAPPSSDPLVDAPLFVRDPLPKRSLPYYGGGNENVAPNERRRSGFGSGASTTVSYDSVGVNAGGVVGFGIPKWNRFEGWAGKPWRFDSLDATSLVSKVLYLRSHFC